MDLAAFQHRIFSLSGLSAFNEEALGLFRYQYRNNPFYRRFADALGKDEQNVTELNQIPFLPVRFFRDEKIVSGRFEAEIVFESSGTTGTVPGRHYVADAGLYRRSFMAGLERVYGSLKDYTIFALLPSYLERGNSSLVYMVEHMIRYSGNTEGGFFLNDLENLRNRLLESRDAGKKIMLIGVTFALLDMAADFPLELPGAVIIETGGMKGRRKELTRAELHEVLSRGFRVDKIHSEYGMTELLSQAWSSGDGIFHCPPWMQILIADPNDPLSYLPDGRTGGINIIDLANVNSCAFLATQDLGRLLPDGSFEVMGRFDNSDIRGCSLMVN
jgi:phenylacetate-coenzyme A ligase PaaK-like adenylate-forming protein